MHSTMTDFILHSTKDDNFDSTPPPKRTCYVVAVASKIKLLKYSFERLLVVLEGLCSNFPIDSFSVLAIITVKYIFVIMPRLSCFSVS